MALVAGDVQRGHAARLARVRVGAARQEAAHAGDVSALGGEQERRVPLAGLRVHVRVAGEQRRQDVAGVRLLRCEVQRRPAVGVG